MLAGKNSEELMTELDRSMVVAKQSIRVYDSENERNRALDYNNIKVKNNDYYNGRENLWNDPQKLD